MHLIGRRADDPEVRAFHDEEGLAPPPAAFPALFADETVTNKKRGYQLFYRGHLRRAETWPPRLDQGRLVPYLAHVDLRKGSDAALAPGLPAELDEAAARAMAVLRRETILLGVYRLLERGERKLEGGFSKSTGRLSFLRLSIDELEVGDPRLQPLSRDQQTALEREARVSAAGWDPTPPELRCVRSFPERSGPAAVEPLPPILAELRALTDDGQVGDLDFRLYDQRRLGELTGWTNNPESETEFFAFGCDGRGSVFALWLVHDAPLEHQPVVFLGSEGDGDVHPISSDVPGLLELIAAGIDPASRTEAQPVPGAREIVQRHFPGRPPRTGDQILEEAHEFRDIDHRMMVQLNRHE